MALNQDQINELKQNYAYLNNFSKDQLQALGLTKFDPKADQGGNDFLALMRSQAGARVPHPEVSAFRYSADTQNYPTYLRNLGEQQAQQAFQKNVQQGIQMGGGAQAYQKALQQRNMERLGYMSQAGQAQLGVENQMASAHNTFQDLLAKLYGADVGQRSDELGYLASLNKGGGGGSTSMSVGGGKNYGSTAYTGLGGRTGPGMFDYGSPSGSYIGLGTR